MTKWTIACDKKLFRLVCYMNSTQDWVMRSYVGDKLEDCKVVAYTDADHAGDVDFGSKSTSGAFIAIVGPNTFAPISAYAKGQSCVSKSSTESELVAFDTVMRHEAIPTTWFLEQLKHMLSGKSLYPAPSQEDGGQQKLARGLRLGDSGVKNRLTSADSDTTAKPYHIKSQYNEAMEHVRRGSNCQAVAINTTPMIICEDNEGVVKIARKGKSGTLERTIGRTHRICVDFAYEMSQIVIPSMKIVYVDTTEQMADMYTKSFTSRHT